MKRNLTLIALSLFTVSVFAQQKPVVDCSKAATDGTVTVTADGDRLTDEALAKLSYDCYSKQDKNLIDRRNAAIAKAKDQSVHPNQCGESGDLQTLIVSSWKGGRPGTSHDKDGNLLGTIGGDSDILVREPFMCDGVGTGLYGGIVSSASVVVSVEEYFTFKMEDDGDKGKQVVTIKMKKVFDQADKN